MKIILQTNERTIRIRISNCIAFNRLTAACFVPKLMNKNGMSITSRQAVILIKEVNCCRRRHPDWVLLEAESPDGSSCVKIIP